MKTAFFRKYLQDVQNTLRTGEATEHSYRPYLKVALESLETGIEAINEPRRIACGAPDYNVSRRTKHGLQTIGYVEAKNIGQDLPEAEQSEQVLRYRSSLPNLILTDYLEFRWYVDGDLELSAKLAEVSKGKKLVSVPHGEEHVYRLLSAFLDHEPPPVSSPKDLAVRMARLTHMIRDTVAEAFETGLASTLLGDLKSAFEAALIPDLKTGQFADMLAQTIAYGLFAARCNHAGKLPFRRLGAAREIPKTNPFLRQLFETITGTALDDEPYAVFVDDLAQLLAHSDIHAILKHFGERGRRQDPVLHFYETYLAEYDPRVGHPPFSLTPC